MIPQSEYLEENLVILALRNQLGNLSLTAGELGLSRGELVDYIARHPAVMEAKAQVKEALKDVAEDILAERMRTENSLLIFFLKTQAKDRGYDTSHNSSTTNNVNVNVDARSLIASMRSGMQIEDDNEDEEDDDEKGEFFTIPKLLIDGDGS